MSFWRCDIAKIRYSTAFSAILASFQLNMPDFDGDTEVVIFNTLICNRYTSILAKMRVQSAPDGEALSRYGIFLHFQPF